MYFFISLFPYFATKFLPKSSYVNHLTKPNTRPPLTELSTKTLVFDVEGGLLRSSYTFPYFMLVALEVGGFLRGLLLLLLYPLVRCLDKESALKVIIMVSFCGLKEDSFVVGRIVLPKFYLENVGFEGFEVMRRRKRRVCVSRVPRVMVEGFLKEHLDVEVVIGREMKVFCGYYTGFMEEEKGGNVEDNKGDDGGCVGVSSSTMSLQHPLFSHCKEIYLVSESEKRKWHHLPREKYPKPSVFHDGRLAFKPNALNTTAMFLWLPIGLLLAIVRFIMVISLPYNLAHLILPLTSLKLRVKGSKQQTQDHIRGHLFACNHRTLADGVYISIALNRPVVVLTYSTSRISEIISPTKFAWLTRNREADAEIMDKLLREGHNVVVCPEGTTCREPYLLRFNPLFAEVTDEIIPVTLNVRVSMFYATTARGFKGFDALYYLMNPNTCYEVEFLEKLDTSSVRTGKCSSIEMANLVQEVIGGALGFECTKLTRKDKYMMLAGNNGIVATSEKLKKAKQHENKPSNE